MPDETTEETVTGAAEPLAKDARAKGDGTEDRAEGEGEGAEDATVVGPPAELLVDEAGEGEDAGDGAPVVDLLQDRLDHPTPVSDVARAHLKGLLEALVFASDHPQKASDLAKAASSNIKEVRELLADLKAEYQPRGIQLDEVAGGWLFRTSPGYAPFVRDLTKQKPVRLSRAQLETLAILAYRQPVTRPEVDDIRGVDSGPVLKLLLERDLVRILGKKDEPGRPMIYGTTTAFLELFGLKSLKDLPTLREFTELNEDSLRVAERELGEVLDRAHPEAAPATEAAPEASADGEEQATTPEEAAAAHEGEGEGEGDETLSHHEAGNDEAPRSAED
jgi:segregation and condensation protein B